MSILAVITARAGSRRLPNKNIKPFAGKPLIAHTIEAAKAANEVISRLVVTTDSQEIGNIAVKWGAEVPFLRPPELACTSAGSIETLQHCVAFVEQSAGKTFDWILLLQPTSPLRRAQDILSAVELAKSDTVTSVIGAVDVPMSDLRQMKTIVKGMLHTSPVDLSQFDDDVSICSVNGAIYLTRRDILMEEGDLYGARSVPYLMAPDRSIDIDTQEDFQLAEQIYSRSNGAQRWNTD